MPRIALFQSCTGIDPARNAESLAAAVEEASRGNAEMLFTPEMSGLLDRDSNRAAARLHCEEDDPVLSACRDLARKYDIWLQLGSLALKTGGDKLANRSFVIDASGEIRARYDKMHLFDVDLPTGESWRESSVYHAGDEAVVAERTPVGRLGLSICYDIRFSDLFGRLSDAGAQVISVPAAFTVPTGRAHWEILLRARAIEAGLFIVAAAQVGRHEDGRETYGHSMVVDPWGQVVLNMGTQVAVGFADIDLGQIDDVRSRLPAIRHRRPIAEAALR
ncbi:MAG TPA: carbon-nitrogen hydrolase family protein [Sphingomicrobium sp.]|nr:carbon-nitrogen hydrolase family protein [Sphingomicrobium sp.]